MKNVITLSTRGRNRAYLLGLVMIFIHFGSYSQCDCPTLAECAPCSGGLTKLTLRYDGLPLVPVAVTASDGGGLIFSGTLNDGDEFSLTSSQANQPFVNDQVSLTIALVPNATFNTSCPSPAPINSTDGNFTVVARESVLNIPLCCAAGEFETTLPLISNCPGNINVTLGASVCTATVTWTAPTASDNCGIASFTSTHTSGDVFSLGTTSVVYTAVDDYGNSSTCSFNVIVTDDTDPVIAGCPTNITVSANGSCQAVVSWTAPTASDNCSISSFTSTYSPGATFSLGTTQVTYTATDGSGNTSTCVFNVIVNDDTDPVIAGCPTNITVSANSSCQAIVNWTVPTATDNCVTVNLTSTHNPGATFPLGTTQVTYTATDGSLNTSTCSFNVTVSDATAPVIAGCPSNFNVTANASCQAIVNWAVPTASDNCGTVNLTSTHNPGATFALGTTQVTYTATDGSLNTSTCSFNVIVSDNTVPVIAGCPSDIIVIANSSCQATVSWTVPTATDNCGTPNLTSTHSPGDVFSLGTTQVTYTATDVSSNTSTCYFNVIVNDDTDPLIAGCPTNINVSANGSCLAIVNWTAPTATDNCGTVNLTSTHSPGATFALGTTQVTYTATDGSGNTKTCVFNVIVNDNTDPVITGCPTDITVSANGSCQAVVNWTAPTASDNCSISSFTSTHSPGATFALGTTQVTYTATDGSGNTKTCVFNVIVNDNTVPVIAGCPTDITVSANGSCQAVVNWTAPTASDNCSISSFTSTHSPGATFALGTTQVTYTATDGSGNIKTCVFNVTVTDNTFPVITGCPSNIVACQSTATWTPPTATDNCSVSLTSTHNPGDTFPQGATQVTYTATDGSGNTTTCKFNVIVPDNSVPVITGCPANITMGANESCQTTVSWIPPTASDNCTVTLTSTHNPGAVFPLGTTQVTYTATDGAGNTATCNFNVTINDNTDPVIQCPSDITVTANGSCQSTVSWTVPTATDNCGSVSLSSTHDAGATFPIGTTQVTYTATDVSGNASTCSFNVIVKDETAPSIAGCPSSITVSANGSCNATASWTIPTATDNCGAVTLNSTHNPGSEFPIGITTVIYTATDGAGNTSTCSFDVAVKDETAPIIEGCPSNMTVTASASCQGTANWTSPTVTDNCGTATLISSHDSGSVFPIGTTQVTYTATDGSGNKSLCSFNVIVVDETAPLITGCPSDITVAADASCQASVSWTAPTVSDCRTVTLTSTHNPGSVFPLGTTQVIYTATDGSGNTSTCKFNVLVNDKTPPAFNNCIAEVTVRADASCTAIVRWNEPTVSDNCGSATATSSHKPGDTFPIGNTHVKYTATDIYGNTSFCEFTVIVKNENFPIISDCPGDITAKATESGKVSVDWKSPTAVSQCGEVSLVRSHNPGDIFSLGSTEVEYTASDGSGNNAVCKFQVHVSYEEVVFDIIKLLTPNGDGINDEWILRNIEKFKTNKVVVVDRWGNVIFSASGYNNENVVWKGVNSHGVVVPTGTYFYTIAVHFGPTIVEKRGFVELIR